MNPRTELLNQPGGLAEQLRALRVNTGRSGKDFAALLGWQPSKVSRLENGQQTPSPADVDAWARACNADPATAQELLHLLDEAQSAHRDWRRALAEGQRSVQVQYGQRIADAARVRYFETMWVPGILQTPEYALRVQTEMAEMHNKPRDEVEAAVAERLSWQRHLYDPGKEFEFLIGEPVLRWLIVPPAVMRAQLDRFVSVIGLSNMRFGVLPFGVELATAPQNGFQIYGDTVAVETFFDETVKGDDLHERYAQVLDRLWLSAVEGDDARRLIADAAATLPS